MGREDPGGAPSAGTIAVGRVVALARGAVGAAQLLAPRSPGVAARSGHVVEQVAFTRGVGARDLVLAAGMLRSLGRGHGAAEWGWWSVASDLVDAVAVAGRWRVMTPAERAWVAVTLAAAVADTAVAVGRTGGVRARPGTGA
jgi:hypothetical protein